MLKIFINFLSVNMIKIVVCRHDPIDYSPLKWKKKSVPPAVYLPKQTYILLLHFLSLFFFFGALILLASRGGNSYLLFQSSSCHLLSPTGRRDYLKGYYNTFVFPKQGLLKKRGRGREILCLLAAILDCIPEYAGGLRVYGRR